MHRGTIGRRAKDRPRDELSEVGGAPVDIAPDKICIGFLETGGRNTRSRDDAVAKAGREAFNLSLTPFTHIEH